MHCRNNSTGDDLRRSKWSCIAEIERNLLVLGIQVVRCGRINEKPESVLRFRWSCVGEIKEKANVFAAWYGLAAQAALDLTSVLYGDSHCSASKRGWLSGRDGVL